MTYDYGDPSRGHSYEYYNFFQSLKDLGHEVEIFDFMSELKCLGKSGMNQALLAKVQSERPTLSMFSLYTDQFEPEIIQSLRAYTKTLCFFHDDTWRVDFSRYWAKYFDFFTTPDICGEEKYASLGLRNAIHFPFGCNEHMHQRIECEKKYDVSFVGAWHPYRAWLLDKIEKAGYQVYKAGFRWPNGILSIEEMINVFNASRINLNMSNSTSWDIRYLASSPRALLNKIRSPKTVEQIKARHFEINGCGGFQLSYYVEGLEQYYQIGKEIGIYLDPDDLLVKVKHYLSDEALRIKVAEAGYRRTLNNHTFEKRFAEVFSRMGLGNG